MKVINIHSREERQLDTIFDVSEYFKDYDIDSKTYSDFLKYHKRGTIMYWTFDPYEFLIRHKSILVYGDIESKVTEKYEKLLYEI